MIASYSVDDVLTTGKSEIQAKIREMIMEKMEQQDVGIQLVNITIQDSEPPTQEVMRAFKAVETAKQGKETAVNNANKYRNEQLPQAEAQADQIIQDAEAAKQVRINEAEAEVARFNAMYEEYVKNPEVTKQRMFYEAMEDVLPDMKLIIDDGTGTQKVLPLDSFTGETNAASDDAYESRGGRKRSRYRRRNIRHAAGAEHTREVTGNEKEKRDHGAGRAGSAFCRGNVPHSYQTERV